MEQTSVILFTLLTTLTQLHGLQGVTTVENHGWRAETLKECEKEKKTLCFTGLYSDEESRSEIDRLVSSDRHIFDHFQSHKLDAARISLLDTAHRLKRDAQSNDTSNTNSTLNGARIDCSSVCCVSEDMTAPFSHIKSDDGWEQVASTPHFPQRVSFYTETCISTHAPCQGVQSSDADLSPRCVQFYRHHAVVVFNRTKGLMFRYVQVPITCKCVLAMRNVTVTPSAPSMDVVDALNHGPIVPL